VLSDLSMAALQKSKFRFKKPLVPEDDADDDGGVGEDDMDGGADLADMQ
jgi:hypothetical protein